MNSNVIPSKGNVRHLFKTQGNEVAGYMPVFTYVDYNPAGYGMTA